MADGIDVSQIERDLAEDLLKIHRETYGKGAERASVHIHDDLVFCMLDDIELLPNEAFMVEMGNGRAVVEVRTRYQEAIEATFRAAVERATGRTVTSFASNTKLDDPHYVVEIFRLGPPGSPDLEEPVDG